MKKIAIIAALLTGLGAAKALAASGGINVCELGVSTTTAVLCNTQASTLYNIVLDSAAAAGDWIACYDSSATASISLSNGALIDGTAANPKIGAITDSATNAAASFGAQEGAPARNGIECIKNKTGDIGRVLFSQP